MFLLHKGHRYSLVHSQRDGRRSVRQCQIWAFGDRVGLARALQSERWTELQEHVQSRFPELKPDWTALRERAERAVGEAESAPKRAPRVVRAARSLAASLAAEHDPQRLREAQRELLKLGQQLERRLRSGTRVERALRLAEAGHLEKAERLLRKAGPEGLKPLAEVLERRHQRQEALPVRAELVKKCPSAEERLAYGEALQRAGRPVDAVEQYRQVPMGRAERHYHEGAAWLQAGNGRAALIPLLRGLARDRKLARPNSPYWDRAGDLWTSEARDFLTCLNEDLQVRLCLTELEKEKAQRVLCPIPRRSHERLLQRVLAGQPRRVAFATFEPKLTPCPIRPRKPFRPHKPWVKRTKYLDKFPEYAGAELPPPTPPKRKHPRARRHQALTQPPETPGAERPTKTDPKGQTPSQPPSKTGRQRQTPSQHPSKGPKKTDPKGQNLSQPPEQNRPTKETRQRQIPGQPPEQ